MFLIRFPLTVLHYLLFGASLLLFHLLQWVAWHTVGYPAQKRMVDYLNFCLLNSLRVLGTRIRWVQPGPFPAGRPLIVVANHQSLNDIPAFFWFMRRHHPKFISKKELGRGVPSISFNLRHGGNALIDRKDPAAAIAEIERFGAFVEKNAYAACIFPEGTRSRTGKLKPFKREGLKALLRTMPSALVVPVAISGTHRLQPGRDFTLAVGVRAVWTVLPFIEPGEKSPDAVVDEAESAIRAAMGE